MTGATNGIASGESALWPWLVGALAVFGTCGVLLTHPTHTPFYYPGGDLAQTLWNYWWFDFGFLGHGRHPLRTDWLFHPVGGGLTFHTMGLLYCVLFWPVRAMAGVAAAYNLQVALTYALTFGFTYGLGRELGLSRFSATLAALGASLGRYRFTFAFQMNVLSTQWVPLFFWMLIRVLRPEGQRRDGVFLGLSVAAMLASVWHYLLFCAVLTPVFLGTARLGDRGFFRRRGVWARLGLAALVAAPVFAFYARSAWAESREYPTVLRRGETVRRENSAALGDYLLAPPLAARLVGDEPRAPFIGQEPRYVERLFHLPGYTLALLALGAAWRRKGTPAAGERDCGAAGAPRFGPRFWLALAGTAALLSLGPELQWIKVTPFRRISLGLPLPYAALERLPVFSQIQQLYRWGWIATLSLSLAGGFAVEPLIRAARGRLRRVPALWPRAILTAVVFYEVYAGAYTAVRAERPAYVDFLEAQPEDTVVLELPDAYFYGVGMFMYHQTFHRKRLMGGYTSRPNRRWREFCADFEPIQRCRLAIAGERPELDAAARETFRRQAAEVGLDFVVFHMDTEATVYQMAAAAEWMLDQRLARIAFRDEHRIVFAPLPPAPPSG